MKQYAISVFAITMALVLALFVKGKGMNSSNFTYYNFVFDETCGEESDPSHWIYDPYAQGCGGNQAACSITLGDNYVTAIGSYVFIDAIKLFYQTGSFTLPVRTVNGYVVPAPESFVYISIDNKTVYP